ncbi:hypothetical protein WJX77_010641 [Trebouxia sp. C0004]
MQAAINDAVPIWHPEMVLNIGFEWGTDPEEGNFRQKLGDVMVAIVVHKLGEDDVARGGDIHMRETPGEVSIWMKHVVRDTRMDWYSDVQPEPAWYPQDQITGRESKKYKTFAGDVISFGMDTQ